MKPSSYENSPDYGGPSWRARDVILWAWIVWGVPGAIVIAWTALR